MAIPEGLASQAWVALCTVLVPAVFGLGICRALGMRRECGWRASLAYAYLIGHCALACGTALWLLAGQPVAGVWLPAVASATGVLLLVRARRRGDEPSPGRTSMLCWLPLAVVLLVVANDCLRANVDLVRFADEAQIWAAKAKVLYAAPVLDPVHGLRGFCEHPDYPLCNPLVQVLAFASTGRVLHYENRLPIQCFGLALLLLLSAATTRRAHPLIAALALFAFAGTSFAVETTTVYADVLLALATLAAVDALLRLRETGERVWWRLACIAFAAMLATKNEGALLVVATAVPFALRWWLDRRRNEAQPPVCCTGLWWLLVPGVVIGAQMAFNHHFGLSNDLIDPAASGGSGLFARMLHQGADHAPRVLAFYAQMLVQPGPHRLLPLLFLLACGIAVLRDRRAFLRSPLPMLAAVVGIVLIGYMLVFVGTNAELGWHLSTAAARTLQQVVPVAALGLCMVVWPRGQPEG